MKGLFRDYWYLVIIAMVMLTTTTLFFSPLIYQELTWEEQGFKYRIYNGGGTFLTNSFECRCPGLVLGSRVEGELFS